MDGFNNSFLSWELVIQLFCDTSTAAAHEATGTGNPDFCPRTDPRGSSEDVRTHPARPSLPPVSHSLQRFSLGAAVLYSDENLGECPYEMDTTHTPLI